MTAHLQNLAERLVTTQAGQFIVWMPAAFGLGIITYFCLHGEPASWACLIAALLAFLITATLLSLYPQRATRRIARTLGLYLMLLIAGFCAAKLRTHLVHSPVIEKTIRATLVEGDIQSLEYLEEGAGARVILGNLTIEKLTPEQTPRFIRLNVRKDEGLRPGQRIRVLAGLSPPSPPVAPRAFDFQHYAYFQQLGAFGFTYRAPEIITDHSGIGSLLESYRTRLADAVRRHVRAPESSIVIALLTGERAAMPDDVYEDIRIAGLAHIIAISGMNIGMAAGAAFFLSRAVMALVPRFALRHPIKMYAAIIAFIAAFAYAAVVGMTVPTFRALIMTGLFLFALGIDRSPFSMRLAAISALAMMVFFPEVLLGASFQMSFAAVIALIWFYEVTRGMWVGAFKGARWPLRILLYLGGICLTTVLATIATAPFSIYHFQQLSTYGVAANFIVVPLVSFWIMPWAIVAYFAIPFGLGTLPLSAMAWGVDVMLAIARAVATWPHASLAIPAWPASAFALSIAGMLFLILWRGRARFLGFIPIALAGLLITTHRQPDITVAGGGKLVMVRPDSGSAWLSSKSAERFTAAAWLQRAGLTDENVTRFPREGTLTSGETAMTCAEGGCRLQMNGKKIAITNNFTAQNPDCNWADIIIASEPIHDEQKCAAPTQIDFFDTYREGAHAITLDPLHIESVEDTRGHRPWAGRNNR